MSHYLGDDFFTKENVKEQGVALFYNVFDNIYKISVGNGESFSKKVGTISQSNITAGIQCIRKFANDQIEAYIKNTKSALWKKIKLQKQFDDEFRNYLQRYLQRDGNDNFTANDKDTYNKYLENIFAHNPDQDVRLDEDNYRDIGALKKISMKIIRILFYPISLLISHIVNAVMFPMQFSKMRATREEDIHEMTLNGNICKYILIKRDANNAKGTVLYFHGNGETIADGMPNMKSLHDYNIILMEYPGYLESSGKPWRKNIEKTFDDMYKEIKTQNQELFNSNKDVFSIGYSIGGYFAARFACNNKECSGLALLNTYSNTTQIKGLEWLSGVQRIFSPTEILDTENVLKRMSPNLPLVISYAKNDDIFDPKNNSQRNFKVANSTLKEINEIEGDHCDIDMKALFNLQKLQNEKSKSNTNFTDKLKSFIKDNTERSRS
ncbi:MAG: alpha/beta fold hydrolase [Proteobacteria bacterium]|nr:alpha/beta fold hydrolase [Pseudomonadota bacterium]